MNNQTFLTNSGDDSELSLVCEDDCCSHEHDAVSHCVECASSYCNDCWSRQRPHRPKKKGQVRSGHEKVSIQVVTRLAAILHPTRDPTAISRLHEDDISRKWISICQEEDRSFVVHDHGRLNTLIGAMLSSRHAAPTCPHIISFLGPPDAGKSTIIKMLLGQGMDPKEFQALASPVVGSLSHEITPTSGDIHLYQDAKTSGSASPLLFADCESSGSPEAIPVGAYSRFQKAGIKPSSSNITRPLSWTSSKKSRQRHTVTQLLYPRLLYTFSDCAVFVSRNPRSFQSVTLSNILEWGAMSLERSINQPMLPHCIVVFNGVDPLSDPKDWDIEHATKKLLSSIGDTLDTVRGAKMLAEHWRSLGRGISTLQDLILCFYASFKVIRIPAEPRYMVIESQISKLHSLLETNCAKSIELKRRARLPVKAHDMVGFISSGLSHFSVNLNVPFGASALSDNGGRLIHLCALATTLQSPHQLKATTTLLFEHLTTLLASCVMLNGVRASSSDVKHLLGIFRKILEGAITEFLALDSPCGYTSKGGSRRCQLVRDRHGVNGHQDDRGIIAHGEYEDSFVATTILNLWKNHPKSPMETLHRQFRVYAGEHGTNELDVVANMHETHQQRFRESIGPVVAQQAALPCFCYLLQSAKMHTPANRLDSLKIEITVVDTSATDKADEIEVVSTSRNSEGDVDKASAKSVVELKDIPLPPDGGGSILEEFSEEDGVLVEHTTIETLPSTEVLLTDTTSQTRSELIVAKPASIATLPTIPEPIVAESVIAEPIVPEPTTQEPIVAEPAIAEPVVVNRVIGEHIAAKPITITQSDSNDEAVHQKEPSRLPSHESEVLASARTSSSDDTMSDVSVSVYEDAMEIAHVSPKLRRREKHDKHWSWEPKDDQSHQALHQRLRSISSISSTMSDDACTIISDHTDIDDSLDHDTGIETLPQKLLAVDEKQLRIEVRPLSETSLDSLSAILSPVSSISRQQSRRLSRMSYASTTIDSTPISPIDGNEDIYDEGYAGSIHSAHGVRMSRSFIARKILLDRRLSRALV